MFYPPLRLRYYCYYLTISLSNYSFLLFRLGGKKKESRITSSSGNYEKHLAKTISIGG